MARKTVKRLEEIEKKIRTLFYSEELELRKYAEFYTCADLQTGVVAYREGKYFYLIMPDLKVRRLPHNHFNYSTANNQEIVDCIEKMKCAEFSRML